jgi:hypothetical protein
LQQRLPFADGDDLFVRRKREQFVETPDAAETKRVKAARPFLLEELPRSWRPRPIPIVGHVEQTAATAGHARFINAIRGAAVGGDALLKSGVGALGNANGSLPRSTKVQHSSLGLVGNGFKLRVFGAFDSLRRAFYNRKSIPRPNDVHQW